MGYDLHITRADDWCMNEGVWISPTEWLDAIRTDVELQLIADAEPYVAEWLGDINSGSTFEWSEGNVFTKNPTPPVIRKMEELAKRLRAKVQGDDGELYTDGEATR